MHPQHPLGLPRKKILLHQINPLKSRGTVKKLCREKRETGKQTEKKGLLPWSQNVACNLSTHARDWAGQAENPSRFLERETRDHQNELRAQSQVPQNQLKRTQHTLSQIILAMFNVPQAPLFVWQT